MNLFPALLAVLALLGCTTVYKQHDGEAPPGDIAVLEHDLSLPPSGFIIEQVDGKWRGLGRLQRYELLPGEHTLTVGFLDRFAKGEEKLLVKFTAVGGKKYVFKGFLYGDRWSAAIGDAESGKIVSRTTKK